MLLLIGLIEAALLQLHPSNRPKTFQAAQFTGELWTAFPEEIFPISEWSVSVWIFANTLLGGDILQERSSWCSTIFYLYDGAYQPLTTSENNAGKWVFINLVLLHLCPMRPPQFE